MDPIVTVIVPAYNFAHLISDTLISIQKQTLQNWECIVVDDGSTDKTKEVVEKFIEKDNRIKYIYKYNAGLAAARNTGLQHSRGKYIQYLDADDMIQNQRLEKHADYLDKHPDTSIVYGGARYFYSDKPDELYRVRSGNRCHNGPSWMKGVSGQGKELYLEICNYNIMAVNCALFRKQIIEIVGYNDNELYSREDYDFWLRCAEKGLRFDFVNIPETFALVRTHNKSMSTNITKIFFYDSRLYKKHWKRSPYSKGRKIFRKKYGKRLGILAVYNFKKNSIIKSAIDLFKASWLTFNPKWIVIFFLGLISKEKLLRWKNI